MNEYVVKMNHVVKRYKELKALDDFNITIKQGERRALLGPNGSGKTTAILCMLSLLRYDNGSIELFGEPMTPSAYHIKRKVGYVPQEVAVYPHLTVAENIDFFCGLYETNSLKRKELVQRAIAFVQLEKYKKFFPKKLSGGLLRRLNIACGIAHKPELLILDEPTVAVDAQTRHFVLEEVKNLSKEGTTILYTTHYLEEVEEVAETITIMEAGKSIASGTSDELKNMISTTEKIVLGLEDDGKYLELLRGIPHVRDVTFEQNNYHITFAKGLENAKTLLAVLDEQHLPYSTFYSERPTLNDVFLEITGKELREV